jgi:hypothetical protein
MRAADFLLNVKQKLQYRADFTTFLYSQRTMHRPNRTTLGLLLNFGRKAEFKRIVLGNEAKPFHADNFG